MLFVFRSRTGQVELLVFVAGSAVEVDFLVNVFPVVSYKK